MERWTRTCQECGERQEDEKPGQMSMAYQNRKCKACKSSALDYGAMFDQEAEDEAKAFFEALKKTMPSYFHPTAWEKLMKRGESFSDMVEESRELYLAEGNTGKAEECQVIIDCAYPVDQGIWEYACEGWWDGVKKLIELGKAGQKDAPEFNY